MSFQRPGKRRGWILIILAIALPGIGLWIGFSPVTDLLIGPLGPNFTCRGKETVLLARIYPIIDLAVDDQSLYWLTRGSPGSVMKMSRSSGEVQELALLQSEPYGILVDDRSVFWIEGLWQPGPSFILKKMSRQGGEVTVLNRAPEMMAQLSMDTDYLYWLDHQNEVIKRISKKSGESETLLSGLHGINGFKVVNGQIYVGGDDWLGILEKKEQTPRILITTDRLLQELHFGVRDERSVIQAGPIIGEYNDEIIFVLYVGNNPGLISCTDNAANIIGLPKAGGKPRLILSVAGGITDLDVIDPYLYSIGVCQGGQAVNINTGETSTIDVGYDAFNLVSDGDHLYWSDREGLKCIRRPGD